MKALLIIFASVLVCYGCGVSEQKENTIEKNGSTQTRFPQAYDITEGYFSVYPNGTRYNHGGIAHLELSAVVFYNGKLVFANDKPIPEKSPVFSISYPVSPEVEPVFFMQSLLINTSKYEDMTITSDKKFVIATTGFDRYKEDGTWNAFNNLLYWLSDDENNVKLLNLKSNQQKKCCKNLREIFSTQLANEQFPTKMPYFKIEGLMALPGSKLVFGIRETGAKWNESQQTIQCITTDYTVKGDTMFLNNNFEKMFHFTPDSNEFEKPLGLSSLEYDPFTDRVLILTSYELGEKPEDIGGFLWIISRNDFLENKKPMPVRKNTGEYLEFAHKPEGIAIIEQNRFFIVHDDDRIVGQKEPQSENQFYRKPHQAAYNELKIKN